MTKKPSTFRVAAGTVALTGIVIQLVTFFFPEQIPHWLAWPLFMIGLPLMLPAIPLGWVYSAVFPDNYSYPLGYLAMGISFALVSSLFWGLLIAWRVGNQS
jgi:hypothetical protein